MDQTAVCSGCGYQISAASGACPRCGAGQGGVHPLALIGWILLLFTFPLYPIAGGMSFAAAFAVAGLADLLRVSGGLKIILLMASVYGVFLLAFRIERRAAQVAAYRMARGVIRMGTGLIIIAGVLSEKGMGAGSAFAIIALVVGVLSLIGRFDRAVGAAGPERIKKTRAPFKAPDMPSMKFLSDGTGAAVAAGRKAGGFLARAFWGVSLGAASGVMISLWQAQRYEPEMLVIGAVLGLIVSLLLGAFARRRKPD